jgi:hypothetical protein
MQPLRGFVIVKKHITNKLAKDSANTRNHLECLHNRILNYINTYNENPDWQSISYMRKKIYKEIINRKISKIYLQYINNYQIKAITYLPNVTEIVAQNAFNNQNEQWMLPNIKRLTLINCNITNLKFIYPLNQLEYLDISGNNIKDFAPLCRLKNLKELHVSDISAENRRMLQIMLPQTKIFSSDLRGLRNHKE